VYIYIVILLATQVFVFGDSL